MRIFDEDVFVEILCVNGLVRMFIGYSVVEGGFKWWLGEMLLLLYSAVRYYDDGFLGLVGRGVR